MIWTGDAKLMVMTPTFDVLSEFPLDTADFGAGTPVTALLSLGLC